MTQEERSPAAKSTLSPSISVEQFNEISLNDPPVVPVPPEYSAEDDDGDIGVSISVPLPKSPSPVSPSPAIDASRPLSRVLTRSPPPTPSSTKPSFSSSQSIHEVLDGSPRNKSTLASPRSGHISPLASPTRSELSLSSPTPRFAQFKPTLPQGTSILDPSETEEAPAPFESVPLDTTPPAVTIPLPNSPTPISTPEQRNGSIAGSISGNGSSTSVSSGLRPNGTSDAGPSTPRRSAPPAHPHPFPVPSSPSSADKRLSVTSTHSTNTTPVPTPTPPSQATLSPHQHPIPIKGSSTFEKVVSQTRPSWLPPKDKTEDVVHYSQWEEMMSQARQHDQKLKKMQEARRLEKEKRLATNTPKWEALLTHDFSVAKVRSDPVARHLWFEGVPSHLRGKAWSLAIGNPLAMSKDAYRTYVSRSKRSIESGRFPQEILDKMEEDMDVTLPTLRLYVRGSPMRDDLKEFLCAWVVYRSDEGLGYAPYISHLAAMFLLSSPPTEAFNSLVNLLSRPCLRAFYTQTTDEIDAFYRVWENLQADMFPKIFANCKNLGLKLPEGYFRSMFLEQVPFEACCRLWDQIMLDGDGYIFRAALAIFAFLEPRLHYPDKDEIESVLEGRNRATQAITERERERAKLRGEQFDDVLDGKLSVFGLNENALFDWLENDGWKEGRYERLCKREMPD